MDAESGTLLQTLVRETRTATLATLRGGAPNASMVLYLPEQDFSAFHGVCADVQPDAGGAG
jgi:hypothetical protein